MSVLGWILAAVLGAFMFGAGMGKILTSRDKLLHNPNMAWADDFSEPQIKLISGLEIIGGLGVVLPWLFDIAPVLTPIAAIGCGIIMIGAMAVHLRRHDRKALPITVLVALLAAAVATIRFYQLA